MNPVLPARAQDKICHCTVTRDLSGTLSEQECAQSFFGCPSIDITECPEKLTCGSLQSQSCLLCQCRQNPTHLLRARGFPALLPSMQFSPEPPLCHHSQPLCLGHSGSTTTLLGLPRLGALALDAVGAKVAWLSLGLWSVPQARSQIPTF